MPDLTPTPPSSKDAPPPARPAVPPPPTCNCGPLAPLPGEQPLRPGTSAEAILSRMQLECDHETGVLFFRFQGQFYLRTVKTV